MHTLRVVIAVLVCLVALYFVFVWPTHGLFRSFDNLERNAKRVITGTQLQAWATGLLALVTTNTTPRLSELGTNIPPQLLGLYHRPPYIQIQEADTNSPGSVYLMWGGGVIGHCGFEIGSTNFVSYRSHARAWQPGVYFWSEHPPK
jgi:hypothetical protein